MLFFFHLFAGIVLGLLIGDLLHDRRFILPFIIGAVLPDILDKALGYIVLNGLFGGGRIFLHSIVVVGILLVLGFLFWKYWHHPELFAASLGMLFHQVLDLMWVSPGDWFFPLFGFDSTSRGADYALALVLRDFTTGSEWLFAVFIGAAILVVILFYSRGSLLRHRKLFAVLAGSAAAFFVVLGGVTIGILFSQPGRRLLRAFQFMGWDNPFEVIIGGVVFLLCAVLLWRVRTHILAGTKIGQESR